MCNVPQTGHHTPGPWSPCDSQRAGDQNLMDIICSAQEPLIGCPLSTSLVLNPIDTYRHLLRSAAANEGFFITEPWRYMDLKENYQSGRDYLLTESLFPHCPKVIIYCISFTPHGQ